MRQYHTKLVNLKKEMANLMERSTRLKVNKYISLSLFLSMIVYSAVIL